MANTSNQAALPRKKLISARVQKFTLKAQKQSPKHIADLEWRVKFTQMKLNLWRDLENDQWLKLDTMHKLAKKELREQKKLYFG